MEVIERLAWRAVIWLAGWTNTVSGDVLMRAHDRLKELERRL